MSIRRAAIASLALVAAAVPAGTALAAGRAATAAEATAITRAVRTSPTAGLNTIPANRYRVRGIRVSTLSRFWATATVAPLPRFAPTLQGALVVLMRVGTGAGPWVVADVGTSGVGCPVAPYRVLVNLGIGDECPAGDRL